MSCGIPPRWSLRRVLRLRRLVLGRRWVLVAGPGRPPGPERLPHRVRRWSARSNLDWSSRYFLSRCAVAQRLNHARWCGISPVSIRLDADRRAPTDNQISSVTLLQRFPPLVQHQSGGRCSWDLSLPDQQTLERPGRPSSPGFCPCWAEIHSLPHPSSHLLHELSATNVNLGQHGVDTPTSDAEPAARSKDPAIRCDRATR